MKYEYDSRKICTSRMKREQFFSEAHFATPFLTVNCQLSTVNWIHTFSAKEKDTETGLSYFGARYYSSDLSIWLSVDPMSDYYPDNSPYVYCGNNPITYIDEIGMDFINFNLERSFYEDPPQKTDPQKPNSKNNPYVLDEVEIKTKTRQEPPKPKRSGSITIPFLPFLFTQVGEAIETVVSSSYVVSIFVGLSTLMQGDTRPQQYSKSNGKNEPHGDNGRALGKAEKQINVLQKQYKNSKSGVERQRIKKKIDRIRKDAQRKRKGENHSNGNKR